MVKRARKTFGVIFASTACLMPAACGPNERQRAADATAVLQVLRDVEAADTSGDLARVVALYSPGATLTPPQGEEIRGLSAIAEHYRALFADATITVSIHEDEIRTSRPWAFCSGTTSVTITPQDGGDARHVHDHFLMVLRHLDGRWLIHRLAWHPLAQTRDQSRERERPVAHRNAP